MRYTPNLNLPVAEGTDNKDDFPLNVDGPAKDILDDLFRDTGWRDVSADLVNGWTLYNAAYKMLLRRVGDRVYLTGRLSTTTHTDDDAYYIPDGFGPSYLPGARDMGTKWYFPTGMANNDSDGYNSGGWRIHNADGMLHISDTPGTYVTIMAHWTTMEDWPSVLPGIEAT